MVSRIHNISQRKGERYFLRTLLLHKSGATSFADMRLYEGIPYSTYQDTCCPIGLLSDDAEWLRCMEDAFPSDFDQLTDVFSTTVAFYEQAIPRRIWERTKHFIRIDFRRRHPGAFLNDNHVEEYVLNEIQTSSSEISPAVTLKS